MGARKDVSFALPKSLLKTVKELARREGKSTDKIVEELMREGFVARRKKELERFAVPMESLRSLKGAVSLGGDALEDSEAICESYSPERKSYQ